MALSAKGIVLVPRKSSQENEDKDGLIWQPSSSRMSMFRRTSQYRDRQSLLRASRMQIPRNSFKKSSQELKEPCTTHEIITLFLEEILGAITVSIVPKLGDHVKNFRKVLRELVSEGHSRKIITDSKLSYDHQGNLAFYSKKNLRKRRQLEKHPTLCRLTRRFWASVVPHSMAMMDYESYEKLYLRIHKILMQRFDIRHAIISIQEDWQRDTNGQDGGLNYDNFHLSLFELIDIWCDSVEASDYIELLCLILDGIAHVKEGNDELKSLQDIEYKDVRKRTKSHEVQVFLDNPKAATPHTSVPTLQAKTSPTKPNNAASTPKITQPQYSKKDEQQKPKTSTPRAPSRPASAPLSRQMPKKVPIDEPRVTENTSRSPTKDSASTLSIRPTSPRKSPAKPANLSSGSPNKLQRQQKHHNTEPNNPPSGDTPEAEVTQPPHPHKPVPSTSPKLIRPRSSPLKRSPPSPTSAQPIQCEDTNFHAIRPINYDFDPNKVGPSVDHFAKNIRPGFQLVLQSPLQEDSEFLLDVEGHNVPISPTKARLRKTPPPSPPKTANEPNSIIMSFDAPKVEAIRPPIVPLKGAIVYAAPSIPIEEEWVKRSQARAVHDLRSSQGPSEKPCNWNYFYSHPIAKE